MNVSEPVCLVTFGIQTRCCICNSKPMWQGVVKSGQSCLALFCHLTSLWRCLFKFFQPPELSICIYKYLYFLHIAIFQETNFLPQHFVRLSLFS
jgi:hypothetical protein